MQVKLEGVEAQLGNNGVTMRIADNQGNAVGRLQIGRAKLLWWKGKAHKKVTRVDMEDFIDWLNSQS